MFGENPGINQTSIYATALCYNTGHYIFARIFTLFSLSEVKIQALTSRIFSKGFKTLKKTLKSAKFSKKSRICQC